jgi:hypothetical protein
MNMPGYSRYAAMALAFAIVSPIAANARSSVEVGEILAAARNEAVKHNWAVAIVVVDDGGHLLGLSRYAWRE